MRVDESDCAVDDFVAGGLVHRFVHGSFPKHHVLVGGSDCVVPVDIERIGDEAVGVTVHDQCRLGVVLCVSAGVEQGGCDLVQRRHV